MHVCVYMPGACVEVGGQPVGVSSLLPFDSFIPPCVFLRSSSGYQASRQALLPTETSCCPLNLASGKIWYFLIGVWWDVIVLFASS